MINLEKKQTDKGLQGNEKLEDAIKGRCSRIRRRKCSPMF